MSELDKSRVLYCRIYAVNESLFGQSQAQLGVLTEDMQVALKINFERCFLISTGLPRRYYMERLGMGRADLLTQMNELQQEMDALACRQRFDYEISVLNYDYSKRFVLVISPLAELDIDALARHIDAFLERRYQALAHDKPPTSRNITVYSEVVSGYDAYQRAFAELQQLYARAFFLRECDVLTSREAQSRRTHFSMLEAERMLSRFSDLLFERDVDGALELLLQLMLRLKGAQDRTFCGEVLVFLKRRIDEMCLILGIHQTEEIAASLSMERFLCIEELYDSVCELLRRLLQNAEIPPLKPDGLSIQAARHIRKNYYRPLDLTIVAGHLHVNSSYLSHVFKREMNVGITQYIMHIRMEQAQRLLKETDLKIARVAADVGLTDPSYFNTVFKRRFGCTPMEYRERHRA